MIMLPKIRYALPLAVTLAAAISSKARTQSYNRGALHLVTATTNRLLLEMEAVARTRLIS